MAATTDTTPAFEQELESYRRELTGYCYRMLGSGFAAEAGAQETCARPRRTCEAGGAGQEAVLRTWRKIDDFEGRSAVRSWLCRSATNVCLDMLQGPQRR